MSLLNANVVNFEKERDGSVNEKEIVRPLVTKILCV